MTLIFAIVFMAVSFYHAYTGDWQQAIWTAFICSILLQLGGRFTINKTRKANDEHP